MPRYNESFDGLLKRFSWELHVWFQETGMLVYLEWLGPIGQRLCPWPGLTDRHSSIFPGWDSLVSWLSPSWEMAKKQLSEMKAGVERVTEGGAGEGLSHTPNHSPRLSWKCCSMKRGFCPALSGLNHLRAAQLLCLHPLSGASNLAKYLPQIKSRMSVLLLVEK